MKVNQVKHTGETKVATTIRDGENVWLCAGCAQDAQATDDFSGMAKIRCGDYPTTTPTCHPKSDWVASYPESRVKGHTYRQYYGNTAWTKSANHYMSRAANMNFRDGR